MTSAYRTVFNLSAHQRPTVGDQKTSYTGVDHMGWLVCDGRALSTETYALLFGVIGYTFGGSGNTFNLPDPRGRAVGIAGQGSGLTNRAIGAAVGAETHTLTIAEMPTHNHGITDSGHQHTYKFPGAQSAGTTAPTTSVAEDNISSGIDTLTTSVTTGITINNAGLSNAHNNMQPTLFAGNMFIYSGKVMQQYFPYTWVGATPAYSSGTAGTPGSVLIF